MSTERPEHSGTDNRLAATNPPGTIEGGPVIIPDAQPATSDTAARVTTRARRLKGHTAAWARRNPKAMASAIAGAMVGVVAGGAAATGLAAWRRLTHAPTVHRPGHEPRRASGPPLP